MNFDIEIDGGVNADNLHRPLEAGANIIVAGSAIYGKEDIPSEIKKFKEIMVDTRIDIYEICSCWKWTIFRKK